MKKRAIPAVPSDAFGQRRVFDEAMKERLELIDGLRGGKLPKLPSTATLGEVIAAYNGLLEMLQ